MNYELHQDKDDDDSLFSDGGDGGAHLSSTDDLSSTTEH